MSIMGDMKEEGVRPYRMVARAETAAETGQRIMAAALALYLEYWLDEITLERVAERAGVSVKTLMRRYGNRDGLLHAAGETISAAIAEQRFEAPVGDIDAAVRNLMAHYERWGQMALRNLVQAQRSPWIASSVEMARDEHRRWVEQTFAPFLAQRRGTGRELLLAQLLTVTDLAVWQVLRNDLGLSPARTGQAIRGLLEGMLARENPP
jgi:AcrR family transcriptional regulator